MSLTWPLNKSFRVHNSDHLQTEEIFTTSNHIKLSRGVLIKYLLTGQARLENIRLLDSMPGAHFRNLYVLTLSQNISFYNLALPLG